MELRKQLPFALLGLDTDNDTVFMNETLKAYCTFWVSETSTPSLSFAPSQPVDLATNILV
ncbi:hypothetical protein ACVIHI_009151 [Bradyrhizobium sp. USDA 4524]|nr:hypothetical protein [Bradyrhizobium sp. USDA 4538]MCP1907295.1 hypothetical protein [Bradyrhizobium sp. USDA 4537]MCP1985770.1 hypothetical protein [Bradyrhizobium sp. USDA 4539]